MANGGRRKGPSGELVREIVFGLEDSLVSTAGTVTGIAAGSGDQKIVVLSGLVLVAVEAISMAAGSFLATESAQEVDDRRAPGRSSHVLQARGRRIASVRPSTAAFFMGTSYVFGGVLTLFPYLFFPLGVAVALSLGLAALALFSVGVWKASLAGTSRLRSGVQMLGVSLVAGAIGVLIGRLASLYFGLDL